MKKRIGILNSGGDVPGLNAVIASAVKTAYNNDYECLGFIKGFEGTLDPVSFEVLTPQSVWETTGKGGTILKSVNKGRFPGKVGDGKMSAIQKNIILEAKANLDELGVEALIVIGGDGTLTTANAISELGVNVVGVPKTIDNDLRGTDVTFGFSTAVEAIVETIDRLRTTASSHDRIFFVETMGRNAGWLALYGGIAAEADIILIPEFEFSYEKLINTLQTNRGLGKNYQIVVTAEGAQVGGSRIYRQEMEKQENLLGGISELVMREVRKGLGEDYEIRNIVLGHVQRGGPPNAEDRILAQRFGEAAFKAVLNKQYGKMVALKGGKITLVEIKDAVEELKLVDEDNSLVKMAKAIGISFGS